MRSIWVIYRRPTDFPTWPYVMREHVLESGNVNATDHFQTAKTLTEIRSFVPKGAVKFARSEGDEPQIVEWWA